MLGQIETRLKALGISLPAAPAPVAAYMPVRIEGPLAFVSGQVPFVDGELSLTGTVPGQASPEDATAAARVCAINALAALKEALDGDLDRVLGIVRVGVFVASEPGFTGQAAVANGASSLFLDVCGDAGRHARAAVGSVALPLGASVEVEVVARIAE